MDEREYVIVSDEDDSLNGYRCKHGVNVGNAWGADLMCVYCESGEEPEKPKWTHWRTNGRLMSDLLGKFIFAPFTLKQAYCIYFDGMNPKTKAMYEKRCAVWPESTDPLYFGRMNCRNTISKAAYDGELIRVSRGVYRFTAKGAAKYIDRTNFD